MESVRYQVSKGDMLARLSQALKRQEFVCYYQPIVELRHGEIIGVEALVRWRRPDIGLVPPADFIPLAEESGLIIPLGEWVLRTACAQVKAWDEKGLGALRLAVNLSARQFQERDLVHSVIHVLDEMRLEPGMLDLEITESYAMQNAQFAMSLLGQLKAQGIRISMDDFGTGYSSLTYLKNFPIDTLKIDRSFIKDLATDPKDGAIVAAVIVLAHYLGLEVVAEGVETAGALAVLREHQCDHMQGYLFSPPVPAAELEKMLLEHKRLPIDSTPFEGQ